MRRRFLCLGLVGLGLAAPDAAIADELAQRREILQLSGEAFRGSDWATLESLAQTYRSERSRTSSGVWKLTVLYGAIDDAIPNYQDELDERAFQAVELRIQEWARAHPRSPSAQVAYGRALLAHAWYFRRGKAAHLVPEAAWEPFHRYVSRARDHLERHKTVASADPWWYQTMIRVARAQGWERPRLEALLDEALRREPLFYQTYFEAFTYLLPKWHGDLREIEDFANRAVARTQAQEGMAMYARIYWFASQKEYGTALFRSSRALWPKMKAGFDDVVSRYPDAWNLNHYAKFACLAGDRSTTRTLLGRLPGEPIASAWETPGLLDECRRWSSS